MMANSTTIMQHNTHEVMEIHGSTVSTVSTGPIGTKNNNRRNDIADTVVGRSNGESSDLRTSYLDKYIPETQMSAPFIVTKHQRGPQPSRW